MVWQSCNDGKQIYMNFLIFFLDYHKVENLEEQILYHSYCMIHNISKDTILLFQMVSSFLYIFLPGIYTGLGRDVQDLCEWELSVTLVQFPS